MIWAWGGGVRFGWNNSDGNSVNDIQCLQTFELGEGHASRGTATGSFQYDICNSSHNLLG